MSEQAVAGLLELVLNKWSLYTAGGIFLALRFLAAIKWLDELSLYRRLLPILPEAMGLAAAYLGGIPIVAEQPTPIKIAAGLWSAYLAKNFRKILGQAVLGDDRKIKGRKSVAQVAEEELGEANKEAKP